jgi:putative sugar O-methyltransferase
MLDTVISDMETAESVFKPTNFWQSGLGYIIDDLTKYGFGSFRSHKSAQLFYVPLYSYRCSKKRKIARYICKLLKTVVNRRVGRRTIRILDGSDQAECDCRLFRVSDTKAPPQLEDLSESQVGNPVESLTFDSKHYSKSFLNYLRGLTFLKKHTDTPNIRGVLEIGGGYGTLGEIFLKDQVDVFYLNVDTPPLLPYQPIIYRESSEKTAFCPTKKAGT